MKQALLLFTLCFFLTANAQSGAFCRPGSSYQYSRNTPNSDRIPYGTTFYKYDTDGNMIEKSSSIYFSDSIGWQVNSRELNSYSNGRLTYKRLFQYMPGLQEYMRYYYSYDNQGREIEQYSTYYYSDKKTWAKTDKFNTYYDNQGREKELINYYWDNEANEWINRRKFTSSYSISGQLSEHISSYWGSGNSGWTNDCKQSYYYNTEGLCSEKIISYLSSNFRQRDLYTYDDQGHMTERINQGEYGGQWFNNSREVFVYNAEGCLSNYHNYLGFDSNTNIWTNDNEDEYVFGRSSQVPEGFSIYPNPASSSLFIKTSENISYTLIDMNGKTLMEGKAEKGISEISVSHLASGIYMLVAPGHTQKIILN